jgi:DNA-binding protein H-NS
MAANPRTMETRDLIRLREQVEARLAQHRAELKEQIERLERAPDIRRRGRPAGRRQSTLAGRKVPPKYRGPGGETWAGRGARPRWLVALLKEGHKIREFAITKLSSGKRAAAKRKRSVNRSRRRKK